MNVDSFQMFVCFCMDALIEDSKPLDIIKLIRKRYMECDEEFTQSGEFYELLTLSHAKILGDRSNFFVYLKEFLNILKQKKKGSSRSDSIKRALDTDGTSDSDVDHPAKRMKLTGSAECIIDNAQVIEGNQEIVSTSIDKRDTKSVENGEYLDASDEVACGSRETSIIDRKQNICLGDNDILSVSQTKTFLSGRDKERKLEETSGYAVKSEGILEFEQDGCRYTKELPLSEINIPHSRTSVSDINKKSRHTTNSDDANDPMIETEIAHLNLNQEVQKVCLKSTNEVYHVSEMNISCSKSSKLNKNSYSNNSEGEYDEPVSTKHAQLDGDSDQMHYDASSSSEEDSSSPQNISQKKKCGKFLKPDRDRELCKSRKQKKYKTIVGQAGEKSVSKKENTKYEITLTHNTKHSKSKSPEKRPKCKSPKISPKSKSPKTKSPILIITDSESDTDMGKASHNGKYVINSKPEKEVNNDYEPHAKVNLKFEVSGVEWECDKYKNPHTNSSSGSGCSKVEKMDNFSDDVEKNHGTDKTKQPNESEPDLQKHLEVKSTKKRIPITTEIIFERKKEPNSSKTPTSIQENNDLPELELHGKLDCNSDEFQVVEDFGIFEENQDKLDEDQNKSGRNLKHSLDQNRTDQDGSMAQTRNKNITKGKPGANGPTSRDGDNVCPSTSACDVDGNNGNCKPKKGSIKQIMRLEKLLEDIRDKIEAVKTKELDMDDLNSSVSDYILEDRLQQKFIKVWKKLCELHNSATSVGRPTEKYFKYEGTRYPDVNRKIEKFINRKKVFPDYQDIRNIIVKVNKDKKLYLRAKLIDDLAKEAFTDVGNKLQHRRQKDFAQNIGSFGVNLHSKYDDPALYNPDLKRKLDANKKIAKSGIDQVVERYAHLQYEEVGESDDEEEEEEEEEEAEEDIIRKRKETGVIDTDVVRLLEEDDNCDSDLEKIRIEPQTSTNNEQSTLVDSRKESSEIGSGNVYKDTEEKFLGENYGLQKTSQKSSKEGKEQRNSDGLNKDNMDINVISIDSDDDQDEEVQFTETSMLFNQNSTDEIIENIPQCDYTQDVCVVDNVYQSTDNNGIEDINDKVIETYADEENQEECFVVDSDEIDDDNFKNSYEAKKESKEHGFEEIETVCKVSINKQNAEDNEFPECIDDYPEIIENLSSESSDNDALLNFKISSPRHISEDDFLQETDNFESETDGTNFSLRLNQTRIHETACKPIKLGHNSSASTDDDVTIINCDCPENPKNNEEGRPIKSKSEKEDRKTCMRETSSMKDVMSNKVINEHTSSEGDISFHEHVSENNVQIDTINKDGHREVVSERFYETQSDRRDANNIISHAIGQTSKQSVDSELDTRVNRAPMSQTNEDDNNSKDSDNLFIAVPVNLVGESERDECENHDYYNEHHEQVNEDDSSVVEEKPEGQFTENSICDTSNEKNAKNCSNNLSQPEDNKLTDSLDSCLSIVQLEDVSGEDDNNQYESIPDIFDDYDDVGAGDDIDSDMSQCSESLLSDVHTSNGANIKNTRVSNSGKLPDCLKCDESYLSQNGSGTCQNGLVKSENDVIHRKVIKTENSLVDSDVSDLAKITHILDSSDSSSDNKDSGLDNTDELTDDQKFANSEEEVSSNSFEEHKYISSVADNAEMIKHPCVRKKLIQLEKAVKSKHKKEDNKNSKSLNKDSDQCGKPGSFFNVDDEDFDLIEKYTEPDSNPFKNDCVVSTFGDNVIELSDSEEGS